MKGKITQLSVQKKRTILKYKSKRRMNNEILDVYSSDECLKSKKLKKCAHNNKEKF